VIPPDQNGTVDPSDDVSEAGEQLRAAVRAAAAAGASVEEIATRLGISASDVQHLIDGA
jgi:DNA-directed RNA polymerase specialized sigma24 family protein